MPWLRAKSIAPWPMSMTCSLFAMTSRASYRFLLDPRTKAPDAGFRCVQSLDEAGEPIDDRDARLHG